MGTFMKADLKADSIYHIDFDALRQKGIRAVLFDIDNTLEEYATKKPGPKSIAFLKHLGDLGFQIGILSNASHKRAERFLGGFPQQGYPKIYMISKAGKPLKGSFRKLIREMEVRPDETAMVGDQLYTDIWGGNRSGCYTVLVKPINERIEPAFVRFKRRIERPFL